MSEDPIGFSGEDYNLYRYVGNEAIGLIDPSGLQPPTLPNGLNHRIDRRGNVYGGFEIHVYDGKTEVAKINGAGGFREKVHGANQKPLPSPSEFRGKYPDAARALQRMAEKEAKCAYKGGRRVGSALTRKAEKPPSPQSPKPGCTLLGLQILTEFSGVYRRAREAGRGYWEQFQLAGLQIRASTGGRLSPDEKHNSTKAEALMEPEARNYCSDC